MRWRHYKLTIPRNINTPNLLAVTLCIMSSSILLFQPYFLSLSFPPSRSSPLLAPTLSPFSCLLYVITFSRLSPPDTSKVWTCWNLSASQHLSLESRDTEKNMWVSGINFTFITDSSWANNDLKITWLIFTWCWASSGYYNNVSLVVMFRI